MKFFNINNFPSIYLIANQLVTANPTPNEAANDDGSVTTTVSSLQELGAVLSPKKANDGQAGRSFMPGVDLLLNNLNEYGCWCYFDDYHGQGRGQPVDAFDTHCSKYHHAVACAKLEIDSCDPYNTEYSITARNTGGNNNGDIEYDCETGNNDCQEATCYAQAHFISLLLKEQLENLKVPDYPSFSHNKGDFDKSTCKIAGPGRERQEMCCGSWKYNTKKLLRFGAHLNRACCDQPDGGFKTFDENLASCCEDGSIRVHGTC